MSVVGMRAVFIMEYSHQFIESLLWVLKSALMIIECVIEFDEVQCAILKKLSIAVTIVE